MFVVNLAYRHTNGDVEGFQGVGSTKAAANRDALNQLYRKLASFQPPEQADPTRLITRESELTTDELASVRRDWKSNVRY